MKPELTIVIATYNSAKLLTKVLNAIGEQTYPKKKLEIILMDGGSVDKTVLIGKKFGAKVIKNPRTEPVYGKYLGYLKAKGKFVMYLDHDEVMENPKSIENKILALKRNPQVKAVAGGNYINPPGYPFINNYINDFGDPFSYFIYRLSKRNGYFITSMKERFNFRNFKNYIIVNFSRVKNLPIIEQVAGGGIIDASILKKEFKETLTDFTLLPHYYYLLNKHYPHLIVMKDDPLTHYSSDNLLRYLNKIKWRVKNNIMFKNSMGSSGFSGREKYNSQTTFWKFLFIPYALSLVFPFIDALRLVVSRKEVGYLLHVYLVLFTALAIIYYSFLELIGHGGVLKNYDNTKVVKI